MIVSFKDEGTRDVHEGNDTRNARQTCPQTLWPVAIRKLQQIDDAQWLGALNSPPGNRLEHLKGDRAGQFARNLKEDPEVTLSDAQIDAMFDDAYHLKHVDTIFARVFGEA